MHKKIIIISSIVIVIAAIAFFLTPKSAPVGATIVMSMTESGYTPQNISIKKGDAVKFVNDDPDGFLWPASNLHPTHELYPEFDPREPLAPGDDWTFVFTKGGEWTYHDHLKPRIRGTITVSQ